MFFQTILQSLLRKKKSVEPQPKKDLSPMAQSIMQKLAEHDKALNLEENNQNKGDHSPNRKT
jgi:hypothetical protein